MKRTENRFCHLLERRIQMRKHVLNFDFRQLVLMAFFSLAGKANDDAISKLFVAIATYDFILRLPWQR